MASVNMLNIWDSNIAYWNIVAQACRALARGDSLAPNMDTLQSNIYVF